MRRTAGLLWGFAAGSVALIALYVVLQPHNVNAVERGSGWFNSALARLLSPNVAGVPDRSSGKAGAAVGSAAAGGIRAGAEFIRREQGGN